jgi:hypothetical protein
MSVNSANLALSIEQSGKILNEIVHQATGQSVIAQINTGDYTSIATMALRNGYEPMTSALSQVLSKTIFAIRPYNAKFKELRVTEEQWGNLVRKISFVDRDVSEEDPTRNLEDGKSYSPWQVRKPVMIQTNYSGFSHFSDAVTIFKNQWDTALTGAAQFNSFVGGIMQNMLDKLEQYRENQSRATVVNLIGGTVAGENTAIDPHGGKHPERVRHLLTDYNTEHSTSYTVAELFADNAKFTNFAEWLAAEMDTIVQTMSERTTLYHISPAKSDSEYYNLMRHTSPDNTMCYMLNSFWNKVKRTVRPGLFANEFLQYVNFEGVNFWQSIDTPEQINANVSFFKPLEDNAGVATVYNDSAEGEIELSYVLGVMFDRDAAGISLKNQWSMATPMDAAHGFSTTWWHEDVQWRNDNTENCVVFLLD